MVLVRASRHGSGPQHHGCARLLPSAPRPGRHPDRRRLCGSRRPRRLCRFLRGSRREPDRPSLGAGDGREAGYVIGCDCWLLLAVTAKIFCWLLCWSLGVISSLYDNGLQGGWLLLKNSQITASLVSVTAR